MPIFSEQISQILLKKFREEGLSACEAAILAEWEGRSPEHAEYVALLMDGASLPGKNANMLETNGQAAWQRIEHTMAADWNESAVLQTGKTYWYKYAIAASVILFLGIGVFFLLSKGQPLRETLKTTESVTHADMAPGRNSAVLILYDGSVIDLDSPKNEELARQQGGKLVKVADGKLVYEQERVQNLAVVAYNTLKTSRGGRYSFDLPDGSKVWLNAASSITFPVVFNSTERKVEITGEVYFEVAKDVSKKFLVVIKNGRGESTGQVTAPATHFNVRAYDEEKVEVTSLTGENPSEHVIAWKSGIMSFDDTDVQSIMRVISRWYNVEVVYEGEVKTTNRFSGIIQGNTPLSTLIKILQLTDINCALEDGKLIVRTVKQSS
jgi:transmembrane sensor